MLVVVKSFRNVVSGRSSCITRTFGKIGLFTRDPEIELGFVIGEVINETNHGTNRGYFLIDPIRCIRDGDPEQPIHLAPGLYDEDVVNGLVVIQPKIVATPYILPSNLARLIMSRAGVYAAIVNGGPSARGWYPGVSNASIRQTGNVAEAAQKVEPDACSGREG